MTTDTQLEPGTRIRFRQADHPWDGLEGCVVELPTQFGKFYAQQGIVLFGTYPNNPNKGYECYPKREELEIVEPSK